MKKLFNLFLVIIFLLTGCASIVSKSEYPINISSEPQGADITIVNKSNELVFIGKTPTIVMLTSKAGFFRGEDYTVTFRKEGYISHTVKIERKLDKWYLIGNPILGGVVGWFIVDPATGSMWTLKNLHVNLNPQISSN